MQVVLGCAKQQHCCPGRTFQAKKVFDALNYFLIPEQLWPAGLQLLKRRQMDFWHWRDKHSKAAGNILKQTKALLLQACPAPRRASSYCAESVEHGEEFAFISDYINATESDYAELHVFQPVPDDLRVFLGYMPVELQRAITEAGRPDHLCISFKTEMHFYRPTQSYSERVTMLVTAAFRH